MKFFKPYETMDCEDLMKCAFNLNDLDIKVYKALIETGETRVEKLSDMLNREKSTIYRSLQKLVSCGICIKKSNNMESGGYFYTYIPLPDDEVKKKLEECIENWYKCLKEKIKKFKL
ncbi:MAG TPA: TrmB family transcriptional regulator [Thermoplasmatales archaeon]|nr:TrmB family transcriptional regulator [Thermoplasmatales archaeon]